MSNPRRARTFSARRVFAGCAITAIAALAWQHEGRAEPSPFEALAQLITAPPARYRGATVPFPESPPRPYTEGPRLCSLLRPICVHAAIDVPLERARRALAGAEAGYDWLEQAGWPLPYPDADRGGSPDFDLYLGAGGLRAAEAGADVPVLFSATDAATTYARLDAALDDVALRRCAFAAVAEAGILGQDPAEPALVARAGGLFALWLATGELGCLEEDSDPDRAPELGAAGERDEQVLALARWLVAISHRHDGGSGRFVRELYELARQHSEQPDALHAEPSFFAALAVALARAGDSLDASAAELAVQRFFARPARTSLGRASAGAELPVATGPALAALPKRMPACEPRLHAFGSAYIRLATLGARAGSRLRVWLRGELGARFALEAVRLDQSERALGRVAAPPRKVPESFLPVELDADTESVLIVVTGLPWQRPGEIEEPDDEGRCFQLTFDVQAPGE